MVQYATGYVPLMPGTNSLASTPVMDLGPYDSSFAGMSSIATPPG